MSATTTRFDDLDSRRQEAGISYAALAKLSGVSHPALQRLLTGKVEGPTLTSIAAVGRGFWVWGRCGFWMTAQSSSTRQSARKLSASVKLARRPSG